MKQVEELRTDPVFIKYLYSHRKYELPDEIWDTHNSKHLDIMSRKLFRRWGLEKAKLKRWKMFERKWTQTLGNGSAVKKKQGNICYITFHLATVVLFSGNVKNCATLVSSKWQYET